MQTQLTRCLDSVKNAKEEYLRTCNDFVGEEIWEETVVKAKNQQTVKSELNELKSSVKSHLESNNDSSNVQEAITVVANKVEKLQKALDYTVLHLRLIILLINLHMFLPN